MSEIFVAPLPFNGAAMTKSVIPRSCERIYQQDAATPLSRMLLAGFAIMGGLLLWAAKTLRARNSLLLSHISAGRRAEIALRESQAQTKQQRRLYDAILTNTPDLAYVFDLDHRFVYANEGLLKMWGKSWDEAIGKNCLDLG